PRVPRRLRPRACARARALCPVPRLRRGADGEDPVARRLPGELRGRRAAARARRPPDRGRGRRRRRRARPARDPPERARGGARGGDRGGLPRARFRGDRAGDRGGVRRPHRLRAHEPGGPQDRAPGDARPQRTDGRLRAAERRGPAPQSHVHRGRRHRRRGGGCRPGQLEEGRRAKCRQRGARAPRRGGPGGPLGSHRVHLKAVKLRGFKSFVDPVEVRLEPGVAVVVGPNGSGKSNISDAILWATGSLSPHELRAEKPDDVLFAGSAGRKPVDHCEVELVFDNADGAWPDLPFSEISLARRLHRGGEGQYLVNRAAVRRIDLIEVLSDVGLGGGLRSVISQGSVETVLAAKPAERRSLVEEAAGLGRFKLRRHRAELKLARVETQVERARDLEDEVRKRLRPLALQATAAERAEKLAGEIARVQAAIAVVDLAALDGRRAAAEERRTRELDAQMERLLSARSAAEDELTDAAGEREAHTAALYALRSGTERLALRREAASGLAARLSAELDAARAFDPARATEALSAARA